MRTERPEQRLISAARIIRHRLLPAPAEVLVAQGDAVGPDQIVAQARREGDIHAVDIAAGLQVAPRDVHRYLLVEEGQWLAAGTILAEKRPFLGRAQVVWAPVGGTVETLRDGRLFVRGDPLRVHRRAHLPGTAVEVVPERGVAVLCLGLLLSGVWGAGGEARGRLLLRVSAEGAPLAADTITREERGAILLGGILDSEEVLLRAAAVGLAGLVVVSLDPDLAQAAAGANLPVMSIQGFGRLTLAAPILAALAPHEGRTVSLSGTNADERYGPELIVPLEQPGAIAAAAEEAEATLLGALVCLTRPPYVGALGRIIALPDGTPSTESDLPGQAVEVRLEDGRRVIVPLANVELLG